MATRKSIQYLLTITTLVISVGVVLFYQAKRFDPCQKWSRTELAEIYLPLADLLERQRLESNQLLSRQRDQDFMINIDMNSEQITLEEALKASTQQIEAVAALRQQHSHEFDALCRKLVDR